MTTHRGVDVKRGRLHLLGSVLSWLAIALIALLVAGLVLLALTPRLFGIQFVIVAGGSMEPTIHFGSVAIMRDVEDPGSLKAGEIVEYVAPDTRRVTTHRIVSVADDGRSFTTKGDANNVQDKRPVPIENLKARYQFSVPHLGTWLHRAHSREGYLAFVLVPGSLVILLELISIVRMLRRTDEARAT
jgi:signal peptidase